MFRSVFREINDREYRRCNENTFSALKSIPEVGVENFECLRSQSFNLHSCIDGISPPFACDFSPHDPNLLLVAKEDGLVHLYDTLMHGPYANLNNYEAHDNAIFDVKWISQARMFLTASGDQLIKLIDSNTAQVVRSFMGHTMSVRSLTLIPRDNHIFASASRDGSIRLWDMRTKYRHADSQGISRSSFEIPHCHLPSIPTIDSPLRRLRQKPRRSISDSQSVTCVTFAKDFDLLSAGSTDGAIKMWDIRKLSTNTKKHPLPKIVFPYCGISQKQSGFSDLVLDSHGSRLYASCLDHTIYEYDLNSASKRPMFVYTGHLTNSFYIKMSLSADDRYLVCGSADHRAYIYQVGKKSQYPLILSGHTGEVSVPRWSPFDPTSLVTLSDAAQLFVWRMFPARANTMPLPGQLVGLTERSSRQTMTPQKQVTRMASSIASPLKSSCPNSPAFILTTPEAANSQRLLGGVANDGASPFSARRKRQLNILTFLADIVPSIDRVVAASSDIRNPLDPLAAQASSLTAPDRSGIVYGSRIVHRYPSFASSSSVSSPGIPTTPPCGCVERNDDQLDDDENTPLSKHHSLRRLPTVTPATLFPDSPGYRGNKRSEQYSITPPPRPTSMGVTHLTVSSPLRDVTNRASPQSSSGLLKRVASVQSFVSDCDNCNCDRLDSYSNTTNSSQSSNSNWSSQHQHVISSVESSTKRRRTLTSGNIIESPVNRLHQSPSASTSPSLTTTNRRRRTMMPRVSLRNTITNYLKRPR